MIFKFDLNLSEIEFHNTENEIHKSEVDLEKVKIIRYFNTCHQNATNVFNVYMIIINFILIIFSNYLDVKQFR